MSDKRSGDAEMEGGELRKLRKLRELRELRELRKLRKLRKKRELMMSGHLARKSHPKFRSPGHWGKRIAIFLNPWLFPYIGFG
ncbi:MAG: hypothetical protein F6K41_13245 [Symploca sp. SIO3E6]|nr:hypothetical protein [Caldora sp. SIO3E6]